MDIESGAIHKSEYKYTLRNAGVISLKVLHNESAKAENVTKSPRLLTAKCFSVNLDENRYHSIHRRAPQTRRSNYKPK
jgi:hypothetical protein